MTPVETRKCIRTLKPYPPGKPIEEVQREFGLKHVCKMASNENPLGSSPKALEALRKASKDAYLYPDGHAYYLRKKLSRKLRVPEDWLVFGNGSDELIYLIAMAYVRSGENVIVSEKCFIEYKITTQIMNGRLKEIPTKDFAHDIHSFVRAIDKKTRAIMFSNPSNPLGTMIDKKEVDYIVKKTPKRVLLVLDEAYYEYGKSRNYPNSLYYLKTNPNVIVLRTFSKAYGLAGLRIGYGIAQPEIIENLNRVRPPFNVNRLAQEAALAALDDKEHILRSLKVNSEGKKYLYGEFKKMGLSYIPTHTNFILFDVKRDGKEIFNTLLRLGVIVRPMSIYGMPTFLRVTIGTMTENRKCITALKKALSLHT